MSQSCDENYAVYREQFRKARKPHRCDACRLTIERGEYYAVVAWVFDGSAGGVKRCGACQRTHEHLRKLCAAADDGYDYSSLWPDERLNCGLAYEEEWGDCPEEVERLAFLTPAERGELLKPEVAQ